MKKLLITILTLTLSSCSSTLEVISSIKTNTPKIEISSLEQKEKMFEPRSSQTSLVLDKKIYSIGGSRNNLWTPENWVYDIDKNTWEKKSPMFTPKSGHAVVSYNSKVYVLGGFNGNSEEWYETLEIYDPQKDLWEKSSPMTIKRTGLTAVELNKKIYAIGGTSAKSVWLDSIEVYDIEESIWKDTIKANTPRTLMSSQIFKNKIYIFGGENESGVLNIVEEFNPLNKSFRKRAPMPHERSSGQAFEHNGLIYLFGGYDKNRQVIQTIDIYNPESNKWTSYDTNFEINQESSLAKLSSNIFVIGGRDTNSNILDTISSFNIKEVSN